MSQTLAGSGGGASYPGFIVTSDEARGAKLIAKHDEELKQIKTAYRKELRGIWGQAAAEIGMVTIEAGYSIGSLAVGNPMPAAQFIGFYGFKIAVEKSEE
ncbi:MAG: hypothetical protein ISR46_05905 [Rhodospirillales bacterium]|nr:hypothetical protein [Rhodospirillales bacterium]